FLIFVFQLSQSRQLRDPHARHPALPLVEGLFCDPYLATDFRYRRPTLCLSYRVQHLLGCEVLPHPASCCPKNRSTKPEILTFPWSSFSGRCQGTLTILTNRKHPFVGVALNPH